MTSIKSDIKMFYSFKKLIRKIQQAEKLVVARAGRAKWLLEKRERATWISLAEDVVTDVLEDLAGPRTLVHLGIAKVFESKLPLEELPFTVRKLVDGWPVFLADRDLKRRDRVVETVIRLNQINRNWNIEDSELTEWFETAELEEWIVFE